ncbi:glycosyltransferase [Adhaeribacter terreus]|uniref:Glycosyltransferase n=1 Tax=Adhaeribacter terreus TaxID=529703 RepID=A0ABW0EEF9_9BACT
MANKKKLFFIVHGLSVGGAEKFLITIANLLNREIFEITIISLSQENPLKADLLPHIQFIEIPRRSKLDVRPLLQLRKYIKLNKPQILFCVNFYTFFISTFALLFTIAKTRRIISYHSTVHLSRKNHFLTKFYSFLVRKNDLIITVSENQAIYTANRYKINSSQFNTIHNGIETTWWKTSPNNLIKENIRKELEIPLDSKVIVLTGAFRPEKNHLGAVKALDILHKKFKTKAYLIFVGEGQERNQTEIFTNSLNLKKFVKFTGLQKDVRPFYWAADLFTLTSNSETFSIAALEAMACGLPCVLTNVGGANEMIDKSFNGFLCTTDENDIAKKWADALKIPFNSKTISSKIHNQFSLEKMVSLYSKIFNELS